MQAHGQGVAVYVGLCLAGLAGVLSVADVNIFVADVAFVDIGAGLAGSSCNRDGALFVCAALLVSSFRGRARAPNRVPVFPESSRYPRSYLWLGCGWRRRWLEWVAVRGARLDVKCDGCAG